MTEALSGVDRETLLAERAEAEAQLRAAEATLGNAAPENNGGGGAEEEPGKGAQNSHTVDGEEAAASHSLDVAELRRAAAMARAADDALARAASAATGRPLSSGTPAGPAGDPLAPAESAFARALEIQEDLPAAWRRLVGALISATGMAIVIAALGWNTYWLLVPIALTAIMTVDLRVAGRAAREASADAARELASVGVAGDGGLGRVRQERARIEEAESRLVAARADRDAAYARFEALAPGRRPSEVEEIVAEYEAERAARAAADAARAAEAEAAEAKTADARATEARAAEAEAVAKAPEAEAKAAEAEPAEAEPGEPAPASAVTAEWWFGSKAPPAGRPEPAAAPEPAPTSTEPEPIPAEAAPPPPPVRALAERLSAEGREALARIEAQLAALDRLELAKRSLEWHEAHAAAPEPEHPAPPEGA
jgi:hypothetical protein